MLGQDGFGMELNPFHRQGAMSDAHYFVHVASITNGPGRYLQAIGDTGLVDHQGMVARRLKRSAQATKDTDPRMVNGGQLAMHHLARMGDPTTERLADALMTETDTEDGATKLFLLLYKAQADTEVALVGRMTRTG